MVSHEPMEPKDGNRLEMKAANPPIKLTCGVVGGVSLPPDGNKTDRKLANERDE